MLRENILFAIPVAISLLISRLVFSVPEEPAGTGLLMLVYASTACFSALLFVPASPPFTARSLPVLLRRCAVVVLIFTIALAVDPQTRAAIGQIVPLAMMLFLLLIAILTPVFVFHARNTEVRQIIFTVLAILFSTPIWLGPLTEQTGNTPGLTSVIVGVSPLSALAVSLDVDYLRTDWFYRHSVLGSLRYEYPSWISYALIYMTFISSLIIGTAKSEYDRLFNLLRNRAGIS
jgi:hypothetical protein